MEIIRKIEELYPKMSKGKRKIADYILEHEKETGFLSSSDIAKQVGIGESSVVRFAYHLGYSKYKEMQTDIREAYLGGLNIISQFSEFSNDQSKDEFDYLAPFKLELKNINETFNNLDKATLIKVVEKIVNARRIGVVATRGATSPAIVMSQLLNQIFDNTILLNPGNGYSFDFIKHWNSQDVLICFEFLPIKGHSYSVIKYGKEKGCFIISILGELASCIREKSDIGITVKKDGEFISYTSSIIVVNIIISMITQKVRGKTMESLKEVEKILAEL